MTDVDITSRTSGTHNSVWVRDAASARRIFLCQWLCAFPALLWACYAIGRQSLRVMAANEIAPMDGWRQWLIGSVSTYDPNTLWDSWIYGALYVVPVYLVATATVSLWENIFAVWRERPRHPEVFLHALLFTLLCPVALPLWWAALGITLVMWVRELCGGAGNYRVQPVVAGFLLLAGALSFFGGSSVLPIEGSTYLTLLEVVQASGFVEIGMHFSWWDTWLGAMPANIGGTAALWLAGGGVLLLGAGIRPWRLTLGVLLGLAMTVLALDPFLGERAIGTLPWHWHFHLGNTALLVLFLAADPVNAPATRSGRWCIGLAIGIAAGLLRLFTPLVEESLLIAIVVGNVLTMGFDKLSVFRAIRQREARVRAALAIDPLHSA
ncbi:MAG: RnfABCDGE type electron transport complex subunit D [Spongiibacteraceae bacterium]